MPERFGLFTLIVLGESIILVALAVAETEWRPASTFAAGAAFVIACCLWWSYFDHVDEEAITRGTEARSLAELWPSYVHGYGSLAVLSGLTAAGVGMEAAILHAHEGHLAAGERWILLGGVAAFLAVVAAQQVTAAERVPSVVAWARLALAALLVVLAVAGGGLSPVALLAVTAAGAVAMTAVDVPATARLRAGGGVAAG